MSSGVRRREEIFVKERTERREERGQLGHYPLLPPASVPSLRKFPSDN